ncbi:endonuclease/exonuclease/phosphatase family metal-dependent hydrolase [Nocardioides albertanoniae]|uniref:Endonuclease/exonuclease/phosphatase family metal-dependent hydrolase n=1 Tax=Nocardioides albertanoniae TaxID=1175486 RepID=A0A543A1P3_9ACTN|nr:endonuclease/exonuclease/phosphatase family protein [Nocardioides albertanoniae]TQL66498.1 endonuclease/exonuclease/phosphatase family metal-dependent hydrolase [Nocardioides albertanoniae]
MSPNALFSGPASAKLLRAVVPAVALCGIVAVASSLLAPTTATAGPTIKVAQADPVRPGFQRFAWLNAWADHHTAPGGSAAGRLDGVPRMRIVVGHLRRTLVDFGVLAEVEAPQRATFERYGREYALISTPDATDDAVFYRRSVFRLVSRDPVTMYYRHGARVTAPVVVLEERATGRRVGVLPVHFPASIPSAPNQKKWRQIDAQIVKSIVARSEVPMIVAGDFNQRNDILCDLTSPETGLISPLATHETCNTFGRAPIDQTFLDPSLRPDRYRAYSGPSARRATDHGAFYQVRMQIPAGGQPLPRTAQK